MLLLRCSLDADSMSRSMSFCPSTIATRSSSCCVALNNMRFTCCSPARVRNPTPGCDGCVPLRDAVEEEDQEGVHRLAARLMLLVGSLLPVSEINQRFRTGCGRTGGGLQVMT